LGQAARSTSNYLIGDDNLSESYAGMVMTVEGAISPNDLGITLIHEHLFMDGISLLKKHGYLSQSTGVFDCCAAGEARWNPGVHPDNYRMTEVDVIAADLAEYKVHGGVSVVDCTRVDLGRNPEAVREIAKAAGVRAVLGSGYYLEATHEPYVGNRTVQEIADEIVREFKDGIGTTSIRPGMIGEIGTNNPITRGEKKVLEAAAYAGITTGLPVSVHIHPWGWEGRKALQVLTESGMPADRVIINHMNPAISDEGYQHGLLDAGAYLAYDLFGFDHSLLGLGRYAPSDYDVAHKIVELIGRGNRDQILISHDIGVRTRLRQYGGWGYSHILRHIVPLLEQSGATTDDIEAILVANPRRILTIQRTGVVGGTKPPKSEKRSPHVKTSRVGRGKR
jgi:phosphotriesterase-related protein